MTSEYNPLMIQRDITVIIPLYRNAHLVPDLVSSLLAARDDFARLSGEIVFINDSSDDLALSEALAVNVPRLKACFAATIMVNDHNLGFTKSCNRGLSIARDKGRDVLLLNSDALLTAGALTEMIAVAALDPLVGFVGPRSNNATICNSPYPDCFRLLDYTGAVKAHEQIASLLPRVTYVPTVVGFCMYIRHLMLHEFGILDEVYGFGYNEENDFIMRCNRYGYRAVLANRAFVYHAGSISFSLKSEPTIMREAANRAILIRRFPEYEVAIQRYYEGLDFRAQTLLSGLIPDQDGRRRILFECSHIGNFCNGTFEVTVNVIRKFVEKYGQTYICSICCSPPAYVFHHFDEIAGLVYDGEYGRACEKAPYFAALRLAQPFSFRDVTALCSLAPITGFFMLDTIALDCLYLDRPDLARVWRRMLQTTSLVGYISNFSQAQFQRRFAVPPHTTEVVARPSTESKEYLECVTTGRAATGGSNSGVSIPSSYILVVGNHYHHKNLLKTVECFRDLAVGTSLVVLGIKLDDLDVTSFRAGELDDLLVTRLYKNARLVLFPSHYEGFGLPIMHSLAHRKPVIARRLPVFEEIRSRVRESANIHLCGTTDEMVRLAVTDLHWTQESGSCLASESGWGSTADALERGLSEARRRFEYSKLLERLQCAADVSVTEARDATADADALRDEVKQLRAQLAALYASTSWRIAKPIRAVAKLLPRKHR